MDMADTLVPVPARRHPHQVLIAGLLLASGLPILLGGPRPGSLSATLPALLIYVWAAVIVGGGALVVGAALIRSAVNALYLELAADLPLAVMCFVYASAVGVSAGLRGLTAAALVGGAGVAFAIRFWQVTKTLRGLRAALEKRTADE